MWDSYCKEVVESLAKFTFSQEIIPLLRSSINGNKRIFIAGNGGSATIGEHLSCDISKCITKTETDTAKRYKVINLVSNMSYITAISNDDNYEVIFTEQLKNLSERGDILILISASGNSANIVNALEYAKENNIVVVGITGFNGGKLRMLADYQAHVDSYDYGIIENIHQMFGHFISRELK